MRKHCCVKWISRFMGLLVTLSFGLIALSLPASTVSANSSFPPASPLITATLTPFASWLFVHPLIHAVPPLAWTKIQRTMYLNQLTIRAARMGSAQEQAAQSHSVLATTAQSHPLKQHAADDLGGDSLITETQNLTQNLVSPVWQPPPPTGDKVIYFTFDDGPSIGWTTKILEILARYHAQATFFMIGRSAAKNPDLVQAVIKAGHTIGNHTYDHKSLRKLGRQLFTDEVESAQKALGATATNCLRPPYGATDKFTGTYAKELGFRLVMWTVDPRDWSRPGVKVIVQRILARVYPGAIVLLHDGGGDRSQTVTALEIVLHQLSAWGYHFESFCTN